MVGPGDFSRAPSLSTRRDHMLASLAQQGSMLMTQEQLHLGIEQDGDGVTTLTLMPNPTNERGGVVVLDDWLISQLELALDAIESGPAPTGLILASGSPRVFVAGADLAEIETKDDPTLFRYLERTAAAFIRITNLDCPSVAVIAGSALGGGLEIAMHCDALVGVDTPAGEKPYLIGLPEAGLGLCPGWGGTQMLPARVPAPDAIRATMLGRPWKSDALPSDLFDIVVSKPEHLGDAARAWIGEHPRTRRWDVPRCIDDMSEDVLTVALDGIEPDMPDNDAAHAVIECVRSGMAHGFATALETERRLLVSLRHTPYAREKLEKFFARQS